MDLKVLCEIGVQLFYPTSRYVKFSVRINVKSDNLKFKNVLEILY